MHNSTNENEIVGVENKQCEEVVDIRAIRKSNLPYIFIWIVYYAWIIVFTTWWTSSQVTEIILSSGLRSL